MFTLYRIGFCTVSKVAPVQCEQGLMFCCGAEIVPKRYQCEQEPYPSYNFQRSLLIWKDYLPKRGSVAISAFKNLSERSSFNSGAEQSRNGFESGIPGVNRSLSGKLSGTLRFTIRNSVNMASELESTVLLVKLDQRTSANWPTAMKHLKARSHDPFLRIRFLLVLKNGSCEHIKNDLPSNGSVVLKKTRMKQNMLYFHLTLSLKDERHRQRRWQVNVCGP